MNPLAHLLGRTCRYRAGRVVRGALVMEQHVGTLEHIAVTATGELIWCRIGGRHIPPEDVVAPADGEDPRQLIQGCG